MPTKAPVAPVAKRPVAAAKPTPAPRRVAKPAPAPQPEPETQPAEKKPRLSGTDEEFAAAVEGNLEPRTEVGDVSQESLTAVAENGRAKGRPIGLSTGLPIMLSLAYVFQQNEKAPANQKMTDEEIKEWFRSEFPGRTTQVHENIQYCRRLYNNGRFTKNIPPKTPSNRYNEQGEIDNPKRGFASKEAAPAAPVAPVRTPATKAPAAARAPVAKAPVARAPAVKAPVAAARKPVAR